MERGTVGHRRELTDEDRAKAEEYIGGKLVGLSHYGIKHTIELTGRNPLEFVPRDLPVHHCFADYNNKGYGKTNFVKHGDILGNLHYNITMRPGRSYYIDGICVYVGHDTLEDIKKYEDNYVAPVNPKPSTQYN